MKFRFFAVAETKQYRAVGKVDEIPFNQAPFSLDFCLVLREASNPRHFLRASHWIETFSLLWTQPGQISHVERFLMHQQFDFYPFHVSAPRCLFKVFAFIFAMNGIGFFLSEKNDGPETVKAGNIATRVEKRDVVPSLPACYWEGKQRASFSTIGWKPFQVHLLSLGPGKTSLTLASTWTQ